MSDQSSSDGASPAKIRKLRRRIPVSKKHVAEKKTSLDKSLDGAESKQLDTAAMADNPIQPIKDMGDNHDEGDNASSTLSSKRLFGDASSTSADDPKEFEANSPKSVDDTHVKDDSIPSSLSQHVSNDEDDMAKTSGNVQQEEEELAEEEPKTLDITKLKEAIWNSMACVNSGDGSAMDKKEELQDKKLDHVSFGAAYRSLPDHLPAEVERDISFPRAFEALLHLATEQSLTLEGDLDLSDFHVSSDK